jgi:hypothetical protein
VTADQKRMWLEWARNLDSLGSGPKPAAHLQHTAIPCRKLAARHADSAAAPAAGTHGEADGD